MGDLLDLVIFNEMANENEAELSDENVSRYMLRVNPIDFYSDNAFHMRYRMSKASALVFCTLVEDKLVRQSNRSNAIPPIIQVLAAIRLYASGSLQQMSSDCINISQPSMSRISKSFSQAVASLSSTYISMPTSEAELNRVKEGFRAIAGIPNIVGAIDGTHIAVKVEEKDNPARFMNRKSYMSINVQAIVDAQMIFRNLVVRWPGSTHDSRIFRNSRVYSQLLTGQIDGALLGDSGYPCSRFLLTPIIHPLPGPQTAYNKAHKKSRNLVERTFGGWKRRFNILSVLIQHKLENSINVIVACGVLWNFIKLRHDNSWDDSVEQENLLDDIEQMEEIEIDLDEENNFVENQFDSNQFAYRNYIISTYFS